MFDTVHEQCNSRKGVSRYPFSGRSKCRTARTGVIHDLMDIIGSLNSAVRVVRAL